jgi:hypothetical protein
MWCGREKNCMDYFEAGGAYLPTIMLPMGWRGCENILDMGVLEFYASLFESIAIPP